MNVKRALEEIDKIVERNRENSYTTKTENEMRLKISDLRTVIQALGEEEEKITTIANSFPAKKCEHEWSTFTYQGVKIRQDCKKCGDSQPVPDPIKKVYEENRRFFTPGQPLLDTKCYELMNELWRAIREHSEEK